MGHTPTWSHFPRTHTLTMNHRSHNFNHSALCTPVPPGQLCVVVLKDCIAGLLLCSDTYAPLACKQNLEGSITASTRHWHRTCRATHHPQAIAGPTQITTLPKIHRCQQPDLKEVCSDLSPAPSSGKRHHIYMHPCTGRECSEH